MAVVGHCAEAALQYRNTAKLKLESRGESLAIFYGVERGSCWIDVCRTTSKASSQAGNVIFQIGTEPIRRSGVL